MTKEKMLELDDWVSEHVVGHYRAQHNPSRWIVPGIGVPFEFRPSINCSDALLVLERCTTRCGVFIYQMPDGYRVESATHSFMAEAETLLLAIAKFAKELFQ